MLACFFLPSFSSLIKTSKTYSAREARLLGVSGGMPPRKRLDFRPSEVVSDAIFE